MLQHTAPPLPVDFHSREWLIRAMSEPLRPHVGLASERIDNIFALPDGGYAVMTNAGIEQFDHSLARTDVIRGELNGNMMVLGDGRLVLHSPSLFVVTAGAIEKPDIGLYR